MAVHRPLSATDHRRRQVSNPASSLLMTTQARVPGSVHQGRFTTVLVRVIGKLNTDLFGINCSPTNSI